MPGIFELQVPGVFGLQVPGVFELQVPGVYVLQVPGVFGLQVPGVFRLQVPRVFGLQVPGAFELQVPGGFFFVAGTCADMDNTCQWKCDDPNPSNSSTTPATPTNQFCTGATDMYMKGFQVMFDVVPLNTHVCVFRIASYYVFDGDFIRRFKVKCCLGVRKPVF